jgi:hypothetical protein
LSLVAIGLDHIPIQDELNQVSRVYLLHKNPLSNIKNVIQIEYTMEFVWLIMDIYLKTFIINSNNNNMLYVIMNVHNIKEIENKHVNVVYLRFDFSEGGNGCSFRCGIEFFF